MDISGDHTYSSLLPSDDGRTLEYSGSEAGDMDDCLSNKSKSTGETAVTLGAPCSSPVHSGVSQLAPGSSRSPTSITGTNWPTEDGPSPVATGAQQQGIDDGQLESPPAMSGQSQRTVIDIHTKSRKRASARENVVDPGEPAAGPSGLKRKATRLEVASGNESDSKQPDDGKATSRLSNASVTSAWDEEDTRAALVVGTGDGIYQLKLKPTGAVTLNTQLVFYEAISSTTIHVNLFTKQGVGALVTFGSKQELLQAADIVPKHVHDGKRLDSIYTFTTIIKSKFAVKTGKFSKRSLFKMPFVANGRIDQDRAISTLVARNKGVFRTPGDIEQITWRKIADRGMCILEIHLGREAHDRLLLAVESGYKVDLVMAQVAVYDLKTIETCHKCHEPGHWKRECHQKEEQCQFCIKKHESRGCKFRNKRQEHVCFRCVAYNNDRDWSKPAVAVKHCAISGKCTLLGKWQLPDADRQ